jgi:hypothetical protein
MGIGQASGENRAATAARMAISSPLLEVSIEGAKGILYNIIGGPDLSMSEVSDASTIIASAAAPDANIIFGATINEEMGSTVKISVIATGFDEKQLGYSASTRPIFGAYSRESQNRLGSTGGGSIPRPPMPAEPERDREVRIDRAPTSFTQPLTSSQNLSIKNDPFINTQPLVRSQSFGDQMSSMPNNVNSTVIPPAPKNEPAVSNQPASSLPVSQIGGANEFEDEFDIPAFLRNKK